LPSTGLAADGVDRRGQSLSMTRFYAQWVALRCGAVDLR
jgi:hypothetical protein